ncbi:hypothetical protein [Pigmentiphaga humi]|uniref:hypothetical protein n=1 Tax=Pigmentiphaga humi TaxID=2478468 RepID=UPI000F52B504|nr:hypothetical protein [Pigmentiphaga humi]
MARSLAYSKKLQINDYLQTSLYEHLIHFALIALIGVTPSSRLALETKCPHLSAVDLLKSGTAYCFAFCHRCAVLASAASSAEKRDYEEVFFVCQIVVCERFFSKPASNSANLPR